MARQVVSRRLTGVWRMAAIGATPSPRCVARGSANWTDTGRLALVAGTIQNAAYLPFAIPDRVGSLGGKLSLIQRYRAWSLLSYKPGSGPRLYQHIGGSTSLYTSFLLSSLFFLVFRSVAIGN